MCGIIGVLDGHGQAKNQVIKGLKKLEYRGYDSWGIATGGAKIVIDKNVGKISGIEEVANDKATLAIGHTRWATHGGVTQVNAHPHIDCTGKISVVHNGIIENYQELKAMLIKTGHKFISQTDTEILPHLIEAELKSIKDTKNVLISALAKVKGSFAICVIRAASDELWAVANGCPLVIGQENERRIVSSDILACEANEVFFVPESTIIRVSSINIEAWSLETGKPRQIKWQKNDLDNQVITPGKYHHFLEKEINEQPDIIAKISQMDEREVETNAALIRHSFGTFFVSCGTSYHASLVGEYLFAKIAKMHINVASASEFANFRYFLTDKTLLLPISQSGETADVIEAAKVAEKKQAKILALVNNPNSTLARMSDVVMVTPAGPEIAVLSTKAFTSQIAILYLLASAVVDDFKTAQKNLLKTSNAIKNIFTSKNTQQLKKLAHQIAKATDLFTIGRGLNYPTALEAALKIKEVSYIHAEGFAGGDLKHGPIALIEEGTPCIAFVSEDENRAEILSNAMEIKARGGFIIGVAPKNNPIFDVHIKVPEAGELSPIVNIIPIQLLSYYLALERGCDPDQPRNLAKSVTVK